MLECQPEMHMLFTFYADVMTFLMAGDMKRVCVVQIMACCFVSGVSFEVH